MILINFIQLYGFRVEYSNHSFKHMNSIKKGHSYQDGRVVKGAKLKVGSLPGYRGFLIGGEGSNHSSEKLFPKK